MIRDGQILALEPDGAGGIFVKLTGMAFGRCVPASNLTLDGKPAGAAEVLAWYAGVKGGAYASLTTGGILDGGESAAFRSKPTP